MAGSGEKFTQSVEVILNFRGIDFSKPENRLNLDVALPNGKGGKEPKVVVVADAGTEDEGSIFETTYSGVWTSFAGLILIAVLIYFFFLRKKK